jgi:hypothetical protein
MHYKAGTYVDNVNLKSWGRLEAIAKIIGRTKHLADIYYERYGADKLPFVGNCGINERIYSELKEFSDYIGMKVTDERRILVDVENRYIIRVWYWVEWDSDIEKG